MKTFRYWMSDDPNDFSDHEFENDKDRRHFEDECSDHGVTFFRSEQIS